jgi:hypothetical protein
MSANPGVSIQRGKTALDPTARKKSDFFVNYPLTFALIERIL